MESAALASKTLYIGCWIIGLAERAKIGPAGVVEKDNDEIRSLCLCAIPIGRLRVQCRRSAENLFCCDSYECQNYIRDMKIATYNVNSIRRRLPIVLDWSERASARCPVSSGDESSG